MKLTKAQAQVLRFLDKRNEHDGPPTGPEISDSLGHASYWAHGKLLSLEKRDLVQRLGWSVDNARCWAITPAGRSALTQEGER